MGRIRAYFGPHFGQFGPPKRSKVGPKWVKCGSFRGPKPQIWGADLRIWGSRPPNATPREPLELVGPFLDLGSVGGPSIRESGLGAPSMPWAGSAIHHIAPQQAKGSPDLQMRPKMGQFEGPNPQISSSRGPKSPDSGDPDPGTPNFGPLLDPFGGPNWPKWGPK